MFVHLCNRVGAPRLKSTLNTKKAVVEPFPLKTFFANETYIVLAPETITQFCFDNDPGLCCGLYRCAEAQNLKNGKGQERVLKVVL